MTSRFKQRLSVCAVWLAMCLSVALTCIGAAQAQPYTGSIPRVTTPTTWPRNSTCAATGTTLNFNTFSFSTLTSSNVTITATRSSGSGTFALDVYQRPFTPDPMWQCVNWWGASNSTTGNTVSVTVSCGSACNSAQGGTPLVAVVSGATAANVSVSTSGGGISRECFLPTGLSVTSRSVPGAGGSYSNTYNAGDEIGCSTGSWTSSNVPSWVSGIPASGTGSATFTYTVDPNPGGARSATITVGASTLTINQAAGCSYALGASSASPGASGGAASVGVTSSTGCAWTASTATSWISLQTTSGSGSGTVNYTVQANTGGARSGTITIAGQTFTVNQAAACTVSVSPTSASPSAAGGTASFSVTAATGCAWTTSESSAFLSGVTASGTGNGTVSYTVAANAGIARSANIVVTATASGNTSTFAVNQASGCSYALGSASSSVGATAGSGSFTITTDPTCSWSTSESTSWLSGVTASGTGSATIAFSYAANSDAARSGAITVGGLTHTVNQASGCTVSLSPTSASPGAAGSTATFQVNTGVGCAWSASESSSFLSGVTASGTGTGTVSYTVAANSGPQRSDSIAVSIPSTGSSASFTVTQANGCTYVLSPASSSVGSSGGAGSFNVSTAAGCTWTTSVAGSWLSGVTASGTGSGSVSYSAAQNSGPARSGTITLNGQQHTVNQASGCAIALSPASASPGSAGGSATFNVATQPGCVWTASTAASFLSGVTAGGTGAGSVSYSVAANSGVVRSGSITVTATDTSNAATFNVTQGNGCVYSLTSSSTSAAASGGTASFTLTTSGPSCPWTATPNAPWISGVTASGTGTGSIAYSVDANLGPARSATISAGDQTFTINQANGCVASLGTSSATVAVAGETSSFPLVLSAPTCPWTASSGASWLSAVTPSGSGSGNVSFTAAANPGVARSATISAGGQSFRVDQGSGCTVVLPVSAASALPAGGSASFGVTTTAGCAYTVSSDAPWLSASVSATGVDYTVSASSASSRTGTITVSSTSTGSQQSFTVTQADGCVVVLAASAATIDADGAAGRIDVTSGPGCTWSASSDDPWVTGLTVDATGVAYNVAAYAGPERQTLIRITSPGSGASAQFALTQRSGCSASLASSPDVTAAGGAQSIAVTTAAGCTITVSGAASWLTNARIEAGSVRFDVAQNTGVARSQTLVISAPQSGQTQNLVITQAAGCLVNLPETMASFPLSGASSELAVSSGPGCTWTATSAASWVSALSSSATGVSFTVQPNNGVARSTLITVASNETQASATFAIDQNGAIIEPTITTQPMATSVTEGAPFTLSVVAAGGELTFQWFRDGVAIPGANGMSYGKTAASSEDAGDYYVVISNAAGEVTSSTITVDVIRPQLPDGGVDGGAGTLDGGVAAEGGVDGTPDAGSSMEPGNTPDGGDEDEDDIANGYGIEPRGGACSVTRSSNAQPLAAGLLLVALLLFVRRRRSQC